jgi:hypothetical protein
MIKCMSMSKSDKPKVTVELGEWGCAETRGSLSLVPCSDFLRCLALLEMQPSHRSKIPSTLTRVYPCGVACIRHFEEAGKDTLLAEVLLADDSVRRAFYSPALRVLTSCKRASVTIDLIE